LNYDCKLNAEIVCPAAFSSHRLNLAEVRLVRAGIVAIMIAILVCSVASPATAQDSGDATKTKIRAMEELWIEALKARDTKAIDSILDNSVLLVNDDGSVQTKSEFLAATKKGFTQPAELQPQVILESLNVKVIGTTVVAVGTLHIKGIEHGKPYLHRDRFMDTWKYKAGFWAIVGTEATPILH
jgi:ketosteroid isomerase-like protein